MRLLFSREAARGLRGLPKRDAEALYGKLEALAADPAGDHPFSKAFGGGQGRVRQGYWRALYRIDQERGELVVSRIAHRREAYQ
jgi:mRNA interferase RelE/StbE